MVKNKIIVLALLCSIFFTLISCDDPLPNAVLPSFGDTGFIPMSENVLELSLNSDAAFVYDVKNDSFLYISGENEIVYPASTTKLLTILFALTVISPDERITPADELLLMRENSTIAYIKTHHTLTAEMLIEGMLLPSGNDAAYALAAAVGKKLSDDKNISGACAVSLFVEKMNEYGKELGLCGTNFTSPDGFFDKDHYSTVTDMAIIAREAYGCDLIRKYSSLPKDDVTYASGHTNTWTNTNLCLQMDSEFYSPYVNGLKTGSAGKGNYSLIASFSCDKGDYLIGLFRGKNENDRYLDTLKIIGEIN